MKTRIEVIKAAYARVLREDKQVNKMKDLDLESLVDSVNKSEYCLPVKESKISRLDFN